MKLALATLSAHFRFLATISATFQDVDQKNIQPAYVFCGMMDVVPDLRCVAHAVIS